MREYQLKYSITREVCRGPDVFRADFPERSEHVKTAYVAAKSAEEAKAKLAAEWPMFETEIHGEPTFREMADGEYENG